MFLTTCAGGFSPTGTGPVRQVSHRGVVSSHAKVSTQAAALSGSAPRLAAVDAPPGMQAGRIESAPGTNPLARFHKALRQAAEGRDKARILFYGDSHVASDFMTGRMRDALQARFGDAGPGFVIAGKPWRSHRHERLASIDAQGVRATRIKALLGHDTTARLGLAGVALEAEERLARVRLSTRGHKADGRRSGKLHGELFYLRRPGGGTVRIEIDGKRVATVRTRGSRERAGYHRFELPNTAAHHDIDLRCAGDGPVTWFGVALEGDRPGVVLDTLGIPGARARAQLSWNGSLLRDHLRRRAPDLVVMAYGTNEAGDAREPLATYAAQLDEVVRRMRAATKGASCLLIGPSDRVERVAAGGYRSLPRTADLIAVQRRIAREQGCGYFDLVSAMGGPLSIVRWASAHPAFGANDMVHLTRRGYAALGDTLTEALLSGMTGK